MEINFKKNIIHIFWSFTSGGAEYLVKDISENSSNLFNHTIIVINNHYDLDLVNSFKTNIKFILLNRKPSTLNIKWFNFHLNVETFQHIPKSLRIPSD